MQIDTRPTTEMSIPLSGSRIHLRELSVDDVSDEYHRWINDPAINQFLECRFEPVSKQRLRQYVQSKSADANALFLAIVTNADQRHIGNLKLDPIDRYHRRAELGILIGNPEYWGRGIATEAIGLAAEFAFKALGLHKLTAGCYCTNVGSVRAFEKAGFEIEGHRPQHLRCEGEFVDLTLMGFINPFSP